jgi:hypothetical protein
MARDASPKPPRDAFRVPDEWIDLAKKTASERGHKTDAQLAAAAGVSGMSITRLWRNEAKAKTVSAVATALQIYDPGLPLAERAEREWSVIGRKLRERYPERFARTQRYLEAWLRLDEEYAAFRADFPPFHAHEDDSE